MALELEARDHIAREDQLLKLSGDALAVTWPDQSAALPTPSGEGALERRDWVASSDERNRYLGHFGLKPGRQIAHALFFAVGMPHDH